MGSNNSCRVLWTSHPGEPQRVPHQLDLFSPAHNTRTSFRPLGHTRIRGRARSTQPRQSLVERVWHISQRRAHYPVEKEKQEQTHQGLYSVRHWCLGPAAVAVPRVPTRCRVWVRVAALGVFWRRDEAVFSFDWVSAAYRRVQREKFGEEAEGVEAGL